MKITDTLRQIKWFYQRGKRGYADCDTWDIDRHLAEIVPPMIRELKNTNCSPPSLDNNEEWIKTLEKIAQGFEAHISLLDDEFIYREVRSGMEFQMDFQNVTINIDREKEEELKSKRDEGLELFKEYYDYLWD